MRIEIVVFPGFDELDAIGPFEILRSGAEAGAGLETYLVSMDGPAEVTGAHRLRVHSEGKLGAKPSDLILVPGGGWNNRAPIGVRAELAQGRLPKEIRRLKDEGATVASVCTGAMILAEAGILRGRPAISNASAIEDLRAAGAEIVRARVVDDGDIITAGGVTAGLDLALWLVERYAGGKIAERIARVLEYERDPNIWTRTGRVVADYEQQS
jgi:transcriptional regulator GlxA family with amidase domain